MTNARARRSLADERLPNRNLQKFRRARSPTDPPASTTLQEKCRQSKATHEKPTHPVPEDCHPFLVVFIVAYALYLRPWHQRRGATDAELHATLPGDDVMVMPKDWQKISSGVRGSGGSWGFVLVPIDVGHTRFIAR
jgi:hypothetical protein